TDLGFVYFFFFQAEDGIRDFHVTGVQTCALPILPACLPSASRATPRSPAGRSKSRACSPAGISCARAACRGISATSTAASTLNEIGRASCRERGYIVEEAGCIK